MYSPTYNLSTLKIPKIFVHPEGSENFLESATQKTRYLHNGDRVSRLEDRLLAVEISAQSVMGAANVVFWSSAQVEK